MSTQCRRSSTLGPMSTLKTQAAILLEPDGPWEIREVELDPPKANEVLIRFMASGLCHSDEHVRSHITKARLPMIGGLVLAAAGVGLLTLSNAGTGYGRLLPAVLLWGVGLAFLTPAVVSAAVSAVPAGRAGLASAVNNTTRQAAGAIGIAAFGAIASEPGSPSFMRGFHAVSVIAAALFMVAAAATLALPRAPQRAGGGR